jgi:uncharacterized membrane protein
VSRRASLQRLHNRQSSPPARDWAVIAVAGAGVVVAGYLTVTKLMGGTAAFCTAGAGCEAVQASRYAMLLGLPTALWGAVAYAAIAGLAAAGLTTSRWQAAFLIGAGAVGFSAYLTWLSAFVIRAFCAYCLASGAIAAGLLVVLLWRRSAIVGRRSAMRPARLVTLGGAAALAAIVVGAGIFAANPESRDPAYQEALARHLTASGAVMYGAFT